jgi:hypothetical protein
MMPRKATRAPRTRLTDASPAELIKSFLNELIKYSRLQTSGEASIKKQFADPLVMRSDGFGYPVSSEAIRIARRLAAAERTSSLETKAQFSAATYESLSMVALGDTISYLKEQASSATDATTEVQP